MLTAVNLSWTPITRNFSWDWCATKIAMTDRDGQFIRYWLVRSWDLRSWSMDQIFSLIMIGLIKSGREAAKHDPSLARILATFCCVFVQSKDTLMEICLLLSWWVMSLFFSFGSTSCFTEDAHSTWNPSWRRGSLRLEGKAEKGGTLYSSLQWILGEMRLKKNSNMSSRNRDKYTTKD